MGPRGSGETGGKAIETMITAIAAAPQSHRVAGTRLTTPQDRESPGCSSDQMCREPFTTCELGGRGEDCAAVGRHLASR